MQGLWVGLFIYSKMPELLDTAFLTFQKKPVIFLHWFHHVTGAPSPLQTAPAAVCYRRRSRLTRLGGLPWLSATTVLLYCWHAYHHQVSSGLWFASMNYCVHSIMYFYYFIMIFPSPKTVRKAAQAIAPLITTIQILQMVGGIIVTVTGAYQTVYFPESCSINAANYKMGLAMYGSYFALFVALFADKFIKPKKPKAASAASPTAASAGSATKESSAEFCNANVSNDAAGFFHGKLRRLSSGEAVDSPRDGVAGRSPSPQPRGRSKKAQ